MADITMCDNNKCKLKDTCYRFLAERSFMQSYSHFKPHAKLKTCRMYWAYQQ